MRAAKGRRWHGSAFSLQAVARDPAGGDVDTPRVGYTLTKKVGGAVIRNRARRRLKEAMRLAADLPARPGHDYVVIGRLEAIRQPFATLSAELARAFIGVHDPGKPKRPADRSSAKPRQVAKSP